MRYAKISRDNQSALFRRRQIRKWMQRHFPTWMFRLVRIYFGSAHGDEQWIRIVMNQTTRHWVEELRPETLETLEISGTDWERNFPYKRYISTSYPEFDICDGPYPEPFDLIIAEQIFEHLLWPYKAGRNILASLRPGGYFLITVPFLIRMHRYPTDCTRWTETGLKYFLAECGFPLEQIKTGSWGNRACVKANFKHWKTYQPWRHSLTNEPDYPVSVWALANNA